jgi:hypothetical protein
MSEPSALPRSTSAEQFDPVVFLETAALKQLDGELRIVPGDNGCGTRFTVTFCAPGSGPKATQFVQ